MPSGLSREAPHILQLVEPIVEEYVLSLAAKLCHGKAPGRDGLLLASLQAGYDRFPSGAPRQHMLRYRIVGRSHDPTGVWPDQTR